MGTPAYEMIPTIFAEIMEKNLKVLRVKAQVYITPKSWTEDPEIGSF